MLKSTQAALKRWVWEEKAKTQGGTAAKWMIDNEYHVQAFLWAVLYPVFRDGMRDEQYLLGYGLQQPRFDIGIIPLRLIVEVKFLRQKGDFKKFEEQIAGDVGLYFEEKESYDRMVVYIYDDCDTSHPELYEVLRNALTSRDARIEEVVFVRRPGMLPTRAARKAVPEGSQGQGQ